MTSESTDTAAVTGQATKWAFSLKTGQKLTGDFAADGITLPHTCSNEAKPVVKWAHFGFHRSATGGNTHEVQTSVNGLQWVDDLLHTERNVHDVRLVGMPLKSGTMKGRAELSCREDTPRLRLMDNYRTGPSIVDFEITITGEDATDELEAAKAEIAVLKNVLCAWLPGEREDWPKSVQAVEGFSCPPPPAVTSPPPPPPLEQTW